MENKCLKCKHHEKSNIHCAECIHNPDFNIGTSFVVAQIHAEDFFEQKEG